MKLCYFITGKHNTGKTTLLRALSLRGWDCLSFHDVLERDPDTDPVLTIDAFLERDRKPIMFKAIDGYPTNDDQMIHIGSLLSSGWIVRVLWLEADTPIMRARGVVKTDRPTLPEPSLSMDSKLIDRVDTSGLVISLPEVDTNQINELFTQGFNLWSGISGHKQDLPSTSRMLERFEEEVTEMKESLAEGDLPNVREEIADMMVFLSLMYKSLGFTGEDFVQSWLQKMNINFFRLDKKQKPYVSKLVEGE